MGDSRTAMFTWDSRLASLLNTTFVRWLLSEVFITGLSAADTRYRETRSDQMARLERVERLDAESSYRFSQVCLLYLEIAPSLLSAASAWTSEHIRHNRL